jgi:hypothetical protein
MTLYHSCNIKHYEAILYLIFRGKPWPQMKKPAVFPQRVLYFFSKLKLAYASVKLESVTCANRVLVSIESTIN